jgi:drug/metabolite transporter (DMT)-like permease
MPLKAIFLTLSVCLVWGGTFVAVKAGLPFAPLWGFAAARFLLASAVLWLLLRREGQLLPWGKRLTWPLLGNAALSVLQLYLFYGGLYFTSAGRASVFLNTQPFWTLIIAALILKEPLNASKALGVAAAFLGVVAIFSDRLSLPHPQALWGDLLILASALVWSWEIIYTKILTRHFHPTILTIAKTLLSALAFTATALILEPFSGWQWAWPLGAGILYLAIGSTAFGWLLWTHLLKKYPAGSVSSYLFAVPLAGVFLGWLLLQEPISWGLAAGAFLIGVGIYLANR